MDNFRRKLMTNEVDEGLFVDLGLPSGTLWAKGNLVKNGTEYSIGKETDWGTYVSWGNIDGHNEGERYDFSFKKYKTTPGYSVSSNIPADDAAHDICFARLGTPWHLPTKENFQELYDNTDSEYIFIRGVYGCKFMKKNDHSIYVFFPNSGCYQDVNLYARATGNSGSGYYWSSQLYDATIAYNLFLYDRSGIFPQHNNRRYYGLTVRPVQ